MWGRNSTRLHFANSIPDPDHGGNIPRKLHGMLGRVPSSKTPHRHQLLHCVIGRIRPIDFRVVGALPNPPNITQWRLLPQHRALLDLDHNRSDLCMRINL